MTPLYAARAGRELVASLDLPSDYLVDLDGWASGNDGEKGGAHMSQLYDYGFGGAGGRGQERGSAIGRIRGFINRVVARVCSC